MALERYVGYDQSFDPQLMEQIILRIGDRFQILISWNWETAALTGVCTIAGGLVGHYAGGRFGAAIGAGLGGAAGLGASKYVSLRKIWNKIKDKLQALLYIIFNYLRRLDPVDYINAFEIIMKSKNRNELILSIVEFIAVTLSREVLSSLAIA